MRILFVGGGTLGPVAPLVAVAHELKKMEGVEILGLVGTKNGPEKILAEKKGLKFFSIKSGKIRRYFDLRNLIAPFEILVGIFQSLILLLRLKPTIVFSGGSFVGVPVVIAAWILKVPSITHQQDVAPSLANKILAPFATRITVVFEETIKLFPKDKAILTGNPIRQNIFSGERKHASEKFGLENNLPTILVFGGGTGASALNELIWEALPDLTKFCQVIHFTGLGKSKDISSRRYYQSEVTGDESVMADVYAAADLVIARAGVGTITELAALGKPAIIVPMPNTHQEANAKMLSDHAAAIYLNQNELTSAMLSGAVKLVLEDENIRLMLSRNIKTINSTEATKRITEMINLK